MKISIFFLSFIFFISFSCKTEKKQEPIFQITGNLLNYSNEKIVLQSKEENTYRTLLKAKKKDGNFIISSPNKLAEGLYYLQIENDTVRIPILVDNTNTVVYFDPYSLSNSKVDSDSKLQTTFYNFLKGSKITTNIFAYRKRFIKENKSNFLSAIVLNEMLGKSKWRLEQTALLYKELDPTIQSSKLGERINSYIQKGLGNIKEENTETKEPAHDVEKIIDKPTTSKVVEIQEPEVVTETQITEYVPYFYGDNIEGIEVSAKSIFSKNKLILIDFWASWCRPCRAQTPDLVRLYNKYHSKGFEILSIAEDKEIDNWKNAITQDNMNWEHIKDNYKRIANMYHINTIPHAILVNKQGGIIAKKVSTGELERLLINEFGY